MTTMTMTMTGMTTMTTEVAAELRSSSHRSAPKPRRSHAAAGSRTVTLGLSIAATAGLVVAMVSSSTQANASQADATISTPQASELVATNASRPSVLLPVGPDTVIGDTNAATVTQATPQPIVIQPKRRVVVKSNGSR
jgi:hypothetical protein